MPMRLRRKAETSIQRDDFPTEINKEPYFLAKKFGISVYSHFLCKEYQQHYEKDGNVSLD